MAEEHGLLSSAPRPTELPIHRNVMLEYAFCGTVCAMTSFTLFSSIYSAAVHNKKGDISLFLSFCLIGFLLIIVIMAMFVRSADFPYRKSWFLYMSGVAICIQSLFIDVLIFNDKS